MGSDHVCVWVSVWGYTAKLLVQGETQVMAGCRTAIGSEASGAWRTASSEPAGTG